MDLERARVAHGTVAVAAIVALLLQLVLVVQGSAVLVEEDPPGLAARLGRFVSYFTIQSNFLVAVASVMLARHPDRTTPWLRIIRLAGVAGITVTGVVHFFLLRPLLDLEGADWTADKLLHMVVPVLAVLVWLLAGPRPAVRGRDIVLAMAWPGGVAGLDAGRRGGLRLGALPLPGRGGRTGGETSRWCASACWCCSSRSSAWCRGWTVGCRPPRGVPSV